MATHFTVTVHHSDYPVPMISSMAPTSDAVRFLRACVDLDTSEIGTIVAMAARDGIARYNTRAGSRITVTSR